MEKHVQRIVIPLILTITIVLASSPSHIKAVVQTPDLHSAVGDERFGINFVNSVGVMQDPAFSPFVSLRYQQAANAGARWTRWPMYWVDIEPTQGVRNYSAQDAVVNLDAANGIQTHAILMFSPNWAATSGSSTAPYPKVGERNFKPLVTPAGVQLSSAISPPRNLYLPWNNPGNYWGQFVYDTVMRYKDRVRIWEMWNEPDFGMFWSGTSADYYQLLKVGYQAAKAADPGATVLFGGMAFWDDQDFFPNVLTNAAADPEGPGSGFFFDAVPWHPYIDPYYIYDWTSRARTQMQQKLGLVKPVWVNETNIPVCGEWSTSCSAGATWRATLDEQAAYVIQAYAYALAASVQRLSMFQLWDDGLVVYSDYYGLFTNSRAARPSYNAYQVASTYLSFPSRVTRSPGSGYEMIVAEGTTQGKVTVVWATQGSDVPITIPASSSSAKLVDQVGNISNKSPSGGYYQFTVPRATNNRDPSGRCIVGGRPYLLVEPVFGVLNSQINSLPAYASGRSFPVSWSRLDNSGVPAVFDIQYRVGSGGTWTDWLVGASLTSATFGPSWPVAAQDGQTYYFRSRLRDYGGGVEAYPGGNGDANTTIPFFITGKVTDNRGISVMGARVSASSYSTNGDVSGNYNLAVPPGTYDLSARVEGLGLIPSRRITVSSSLPYFFVIPPLNNYVSNWGFEGDGGVSEWWTPSGEVNTSTAWMHSGAKSAKLGLESTAGDASLSQTNINVPGGTYKPTVSFVYAVLSSPGAGDTFYLDVTGPLGTVSYPIPLNTQGTWAHKWFDLGNVSGNLTLTFRLHKATASQLHVFLDEVSVGKASGGPFKTYFPLVPN